VALYLALVVGSWVVPRIPRQLAYFVATCAGVVAFLLAQRSRRNSEANLSVVLGQQPISPPVRISAMLAFCYNARNWVDTLLLGRLSPADLESSIHLEGWEHLESALSEGKGVILVGLHLGNIDVVGQIVAARGIAMTIPVESMRPPALFRRLQRLRQSMGIKTVPVTESPRTLLEALQRNEIVALTCDRNLGDGGVEVRFFGRPTQVSKGPAWLATRSEAPVVMGYGLRRPDNGFDARVLAPLQMRRTGRRQADLQANAQTIMAQAESLIRAHPAQWMMFARLWPEVVRQQRNAQSTHVVPESKRSTSGKGWVRLIR